MATPQSDIAVNLSYVLHERSDSPVIVRYAAAIERERPARERLVSNLAHVPVSELRQRVFFERDGLRLDQSSSRVLSLKIGAWRILEDVLRAACPPFVRESHSILLVDGESEPRATRTLFRGPAHLCIPTDATAGVSDYFAAVLVRPGGSALQLRLEPLDASESADGWDATAKVLEKTIREFVLQWDCARSLWSHPAETLLPEFGTHAHVDEDA